MPRKINPLPFSENNQQALEPWSLPDWLVGSEPGMLSQRANRAPASVDPSGLLTPDSIAALTNTMPKEPLMSTGMPAQLPVSQKPATISDKPINPALKQALMAKMAQPSVETKSPSVDQDALAQQQYEEGKVNPWLAFASGIGQTLQGKSPDLSWQDQQNKLVYDKTLGKLALSKKDAETKRQFDEEMAYKNKKLKSDEARDRVNAELQNQYRRDARDLKTDERARERMTTFGEARTIEDAKKLKDAAELKANFDNKLNEMIALREKHGGGATMNREDVNRGKQLSKDLLLAYKDMSKLGVLSMSDMSILNKIIPDDPLAYDFEPNQDSIMSNLRKFKSDTEKDFSNKLSNRLINPPAPTAEQSAPSPVDSKIEKFMQKNGISDRNEAIRILKEHGKL